MKKFIKLFLFLFFLQLNSAMKVFIVCVKTFPPAQGTAVLNHITGLLDWNCDIKIYSEFMPKVENTNQDIEKYKLMNFVEYKNIPSNINDYDLILAEFGTRGVEFIKYRTDKTKLVTCFRGADMGPQLNNNLLFYKNLFSMGDLFLPVCKAFKEKLIRYGCPVEKIKILYSGIDCEQFYYKQRKIKNDKPIRVISVNRLVSKKGIEYAIEAVANLVNKGYKIQYTIVGEGPRRSSWEKIVQNLHMKDVITFVGRKQMKEVIEILHQHHIFILPSVEAEDGDEEGIPNAAKEAMACGLPVILTDHSGNGELVEHGVSGLLVQQKSVEKLEDALEYLINNKQLWNKFGKAGRKKVEKDFEKNKLNKKLYDLLQKVVRDEM